MILANRMFQLCLRFEQRENCPRSVLAQQIWDLAQDKKNPSDYATAIDESEIGAFNFTDEFIFDLWAAIDDIKAGRVKEEEDYENERL